MASGFSKGRDCRLDRSDGLGRSSKPVIPTPEAKPGLPGGGDRAPRESSQPLSKDAVINGGYGLYSETREANQATQFPLVTFQIVSDAIVIGIDRTNALR